VAGPARGRSSGGPRASARKGPCQWPALGCRSGPHYPTQSPSPAGGRAARPGPGGPCSAAACPAVTAETRPATRSGYSGTRLRNPEALHGFTYVPALLSSRSGPLAGGPNRRRRGFKVVGRCMQLDLNSDLLRLRRAGFNKMHAGFCAGLVTRMLWSALPYVHLPS
jgi:hypothetical protein